MGVRKDITGQRFGKLTALRFVEGGSNSRWRCVCACGRETVAILGNLRNGRHKTCGCERYPKRKDRVIQAGYVFVIVPDHPRANPRTGRVREHILVMERKLGRYLLPLEEVHHKNGQRADNRLCNLELWSRSHPAGGRVADLVRWARELLATYLKP